MVVLDAGIKTRALEAACVLGKMAPVRAVYVFGSFVEGHPHPYSDLDIAVFLDGLDDSDMRRRARAMFQVQKQVGLDVEAHLFPTRALEQPEKGSFASHIMQNGVRLDLQDTVA